MTRPLGARHGRPQGPLRSDERSVSDVIGSILLVGITVVMAAAFGAVVLAYDGPEDQVHAQLAVTVGPGSDGDWGANDAVLEVRHLGGEALDQAAVRVRYAVAGGAVQQVAPTFAGGTLTVGEEWTTTISANAGDQVLVDVVVDAGVQSQLMSTGVASAGAAPALLTYVSTITATAGKGTVTAAANAAAANDNLDAMLEEGPLTGTTTQLTRSPASTSNSGASNSNVGASDDSRAVLDLAADWVQGSSFTANPGGVSVTDLSIGFEGRGTQTCSQVARTGSVLSNAGSGGTSIAAGITVTVATGITYVAAIAVGDDTANDVTAVSGPSGVVWSPVQQATNGNNRLEVWVGTGTATIGAGFVTASVPSGIDNAAIVVTQYTNVDASSPVQDSIVGSGTSGTSATTAIAGTATTGWFYFASNAGTAGTGTPHDFVTPTDANQRADLDGGGEVQLGVADQAAAATNAGSATLPATFPWEAVGVTLKPSCTALPSVQLSYLLNGVATGTPQTFALTTSDASSSINIISDRTWAVSDIALLSVRVTLPSTTAGSTAEIDHVYLVLTTSDTVTQYRAEFFLDFTTVPLSTTEVVQLRYKTNGADSFVAAVYDGSAYRTCPGLLSAITYAVLSCAIDEATEHESTSPNVRIRIQDSTPAGTTRGTLLLDYARVSGS